MSVLGLALGVAVLIVVLSVLNGFETRAAQPHAGRDLARHHHRRRWRDRRLAQAQAGRGARVPGVTAAVPFIESRGLLANGERVAGAMVRGVLPEEEVKAVGLGARLKSGRARRPRGRQVPHHPGQRAGDGTRRGRGRHVVLMAPEGSATPAGFVPRMTPLHRERHLRVGHVRVRPRPGAHAHEDAAKLYRLGDSVTGLRLALEDPFLRAAGWCATWRTTIDYDGSGYYVERLDARSRRISSARSSSPSR